MSDDSLKEVDGDIHRVGNQEYTRGKFGSFNIYTVRIRDLFVVESFFNHEGITSFSSLKGTAYIPNTGLVGSWIPNPVSIVDAFRNARCKHYQDIVAANPADQKYLANWLARAQK